jgi:dihydrofolate reductase
MGQERRIVVFNRVTADGLFAGPDGNLDWVVPDTDIDHAGAEGLSGFDGILFGRRTYEMFASFWPHAAQDSGAAQNPHDPQGASAAMRAMALWLNETSKIVFSKSMDDAAWNNTRIIRTLDPTEIAALKRAPGKDLMIFGSASIVTELTRHRLIDEYRLVVNPVLLGDGLRLFGSLPEAVSLALVEVKAYGSGNVMLRYRLGS